MGVCGSCWVLVSTKLDEMPLFAFKVADTWSGGSHSFLTNLYFFLQLIIIKLNLFCLFFSGLFVVMLLFKISISNKVGVKEYNHKKMKSADQKCGRWSHLWPAARNMPHLHCSHGSVREK